jgi:hypothetical protein
VKVALGAGRRRSLARIDVEDLGVPVGKYGGSSEQESFLHRTR